MNGNPADEEDDANEIEERQRVLEAYERAKAIIAGKVEDFLRLDHAELTIKKSNSTLTIEETRKSRVEC